MAGDLGAAAGGLGCEIMSYGVWSFMSDGDGDSCWGAHLFT
jgi:hypothetical protein